jgi:hybrid cluster-associated redox disulfide protein
MFQRTTDIDVDTPVDEVMRRWPSTIRVFLDFRMACVGCPIAAFHTVADACREHGAEPAAFLSRLRDTIRREERPPSVVRPRLVGNAEQPVRVA